MIPIQCRAAAQAVGVTGRRGGERGGRRVTLERGAGGLDWNAECVRSAASYNGHWVIRIMMSSVKSAWPWRGFMKIFTSVSPSNQSWDVLRVPSRGLAATTSASDALTNAAEELVQFIEKMSSNQNYLRLQKDH